MLGASELFRVGGRVAFLSLEPHLVRVVGLLWFGGLEALYCHSTCSQTKAGLHRFGQPLSVGPVQAQSVNSDVNVVS